MKDFDLTKFWIVSREYAGIAEAGGVKNVACSMAEGLASYGAEVSVFIPRYGCSEVSKISNFHQKVFTSVKVKVDNRDYFVDFSVGLLKGVRIVFVENEIFSSKNSVYVYTHKDEEKNPEFKTGTGFLDSFYMNSVFQQAVLQFGILSKENPDLIHCHDAATALVPSFAREKDDFKEHYQNTKFIVTIHNSGPGYHHGFSNLDVAKKFTGFSDEFLLKGLNYSLGLYVEPFLLASASGAYLTTVSPWYAEELMDPGNNNTMFLSREFYQRGIKIEGIVNGIDYDKYNPKDKNISLLPFEFDPEKNDFEGKYQTRKFLLENISKKDFFPKNLTVYGDLSAIDENTVFFAYQGRVVNQKGIHLLSKSAEIMFKNKLNVACIINGQGQTELEDEQINNTKKYKGRFVYIKGYERRISRICVASADFLVLPSIFEPCCLEDFIAQIFGTLPIAHASGGLKKIQNEKTGFLYSDNTVEKLYEKIKYAYDLKLEKSAFINTMRVNAAREVHIKFSWANIIKNSYLPLFRKCLKTF